MRDKSDNSAVIAFKLRYKRDIIAQKSTIMDLAGVLDGDDEDGRDGNGSSSGGGGSGSGGGADSDEAEDEAELPLGEPIEALPFINAHTGP